MGKAAANVSTIFYSLNLKEKKVTKIAPTFGGFQKLAIIFANLDQFFSTFYGKRKQLNCNTQHTHVIGAVKMAIIDAFAANNTRASHTNTPTSIYVPRSSSSDTTTTVSQHHFLQCHHFHHLPPTSDEDDRRIIKRNMF
ncbi:hypothetical protein V9T40_014139 [Parthenolecanium corni]|uniref:Uncharacterized protein n=1 Tax=Parthenolecanium corni TaxID=536013 RepID=A0AAN9TDZ0_9HEMI